jgi:hypothetical protein
MVYGTQIRRCASGLTASCLLLLLSACAPTSQVVKREVEKERVPQSLLVRCPEPQLSGDTNGELYEFTQELRLRLKNCNKQLEEIEKWGATPPK